MEKWIDIVRSNNNELNINIILVGNKIDLNDGREVLYEEGIQKRNEFHLDGFCEISAKNGDGIENLFKQISKILYNDIFYDNDIASSVKRKIKLKEFRDNRIKRKCC